MRTRYTYTVDPDQVVYPHPSDLPKSVIVRGKRYDRAYTFLKKKDALARQRYYRSNDIHPMDAVIKKDQYGYSIYVRNQEAKRSRSHAKTESVEEILREAKYHKKEGDKYGSLMYSNPGKYSRYYGQPVPFGYEAEIAEYKKLRDFHKRKYDRLMDKLDQDTWNGPYYLKKKKGGK